MYQDYKMITPEFSIALVPHELVCWLLKDIVIDWSHQHWIRLKMERERERERQTDRQTDTQTPRHRQTNRKKDRQTDRQTEIVLHLVNAVCVRMTHPCHRHVLAWTLCSDHLHHSAAGIYICIIYSLFTLRRARWERAVLRVNRLYREIETMQCNWYLRNADYCRCLFSIVEPVLSSYL